MYTFFYITFLSLLTEVHKMDESFEMNFQVVVSVEHFVTFMGHFVFLFLTRPSAHNKNFPYHVRTTQVTKISSVMNKANGNTCNVIKLLPVVEATRIDSLKSN